MCQWAGPLVVGQLVLPIEAGRPSALISAVPSGDHWVGAGVRTDQRQARSRSLGAGYHWWWLPLLA